MHVLSPSRRELLFAAALAVALVPLAAQTPQEPVDLAAIQRIKDEGLTRSRVMDTVSHLTDLHGPRLTNSPNMHRAAEFVRTRMKEFGIDNVQFETWGRFGRGWENEHTSIHVTSPTRWPVVGFSKAWAPGTNGAVSAEAVYAPITSVDQLDGYRGQLKGKWVLLSPARQVNSLFSAPARRYTDAELDTLATQVLPNAAPQVPSLPAPAQTPASPEEFRRQRMAFLVAEGAAGVIEVSPATRGDNLTVLIGGPVAGEGTRDPKDPPPLPHLVFAAEHYHRIVRLLALKQPVTLDVDVRNRFHDDNLDTYNIVAELPGTEKPDEIVLLGAHFDSWHIGTGATDNGASSAVIMEAMRILQATGLPLRRTVRMVLWTGEEQGLLGSRAYVTRHFGGRDKVPPTPQHEKVMAYFNQDNGAGGYRGVYLQGNEAVRPIFEAWMKPFENLGMRTLSIRSTGSTDHVGFDEAGLPGFQFIQDPMDYGTWTHHTQQDLYERVNPQDTMKNAVIMASFVYHAANRNEMLPRKAVRPATGQ
jgi:carboxypeptidase Q